MANLEDQGEKATSPHTDLATTQHRQRHDSSVSSSITVDNNNNDQQESEGVNVKAAEQEFENLRRQLSKASSLHRTQTGEKDIEAADDDDFDLLEYLSSTAAEQGAHGFKRKHVGVTWENVEVIAPGGMKIHIRTFPDAVKEFCLWPVIQIGKMTGKFAPQPKTLLTGFDGVLKPGEMCLVLGRPGSGCSTFLKTITNQRGGYLAVNGDVRYAGATHDEFKKRYRGQVVYNQEDDLHNATLTVGQTLSFALDTKTPGKRLPQQSRKDFKKTIADLLLKMLNITHTKNTLVGNEYIRGVSGGERKRVSIAEMMTTRSTVSSWDNSTRGLDASTALDYAKSLRIFSDVFGVTQFVSLYQAGEGIYDQFDKVLVIDDGRMAFFGPANEARQYFIDLGYRDLPRQTTADYLTGCTDENERAFAEGHDASNTPSNPKAFEEAFRNSKHYARMVQERKEYNDQMEKDKSTQEEFRAAVVDEQNKGVSKKSPYTVSFLGQVWALAIRQFRLRLQDRLGLAVSYITAIIVALITGSVYLNLPETTSGAFTRGGVLFIALLFNSFQAFNELPTQMMGRPIMWKQTSFAFYRPAALALGSTIADIPINLLQIIIFSIIIYFMTGLYTSAGAFFTFLLVVWTTFLALSAFFRLIGTMCSSYDLASRMASIIVSGFVLYSGYMVPYFNMQVWIRWIYWINPLNYGFAAVMANEFKRFDLTCDAQYIVPSNVGGLTKYPTTVGPNQVCSLQGGQQGEPIIRGRDYINSGFDYDIGDQWRNWGILVVFFFFFVLCQMVSQEVFKHGADMPAITVFAKETKELNQLNEKLQANKEKYRKGEAEQDLSSMTTSKKPFTWENLSYDVPVSGGKKRLLDDVFGYVKPGTLTALMGASGAGKTTLLDVLANRKTIGVIGGDILVNGRPKDKSFQRGTAYVEQLDTHEATATVREAMRFSAYLRQPESVPKEEKEAYVEEVIQLLEMEDLADAMIGFPGFGLSVEARKRLTIGVELAAKPQLLLFLDEPTSGLDGQSAYNLVRFLRKLAAAGQAILCTIHQPNALLFENFDRLLLLKKGGRTVYFGDIGKDSHVLREYLAKNGAVCPPTSNPAEYMLDAIGAGTQKQVGTKDWADIWQDSPEFQTVRDEIKNINSESLAKPEERDPEAEKEYSTSFVTQLKLVANRALVSFYRQPDYQFTRLFNHMSIAFFTSLTFLQVGNGSADLQYRVFAIFIATVMPAIIITQIEPMYILSRMTFLRESSSKMYSEIVFALSQLLAESPYSVLCAVAYFLLFYYPAGFNYSSSRAGYFFLMILTTEFYSVTLGQAVGALSPTIFVATIFNPFLLVIFSLFCGVTIPKPNMIHFWRVWMYELDPFTRLISGLVSNELHGLEIQCTDREFFMFQPPQGQTCDEWAGDYVKYGTGYINNPNATSDCQYCQYKYGDEFYTPLDIDFDNRYRDWGIFLAFTVFNALVTLVAARFLKYANR